MDTIAAVGFYSVPVIARYASVEISSVVIASPAACKDPLLIQVKPSDKRSSGDIGINQYTFPFTVASFSPVNESPGCARTSPLMLTDIPSVG